MRLHPNIKDTSNSKLSQTQINQNKSPIYYNQHQLNRHDHYFTTRRKQSKIPSQAIHLHFQESQDISLKQKSNSLTAYCQKLGVFPQKKYSKLTTFLKECERRDFIPKKEKEQSRNCQDKNTKNEGFKGFAEWHLRKSHQDFHKVSNPESPYHRKQQIEELSVINIKDPLKNTQIPLNIHKKQKKDQEQNQRKRDIKEKIKDRVKQQINHLIKRSSQDKNKLQTPKKTLCFRPDILNQQLLISSHIQNPKKEQADFKNLLLAPQKSIALKQGKLSLLPFSSRNIRTSFDNRSPNKGNDFKINKKMGRKSSINEFESKLLETGRNRYQYQNYRRSFSTDVRKMNKKHAQTVKLDIQKDKDIQEIKPWIISNMEEQQQNF